MGRMLIKDTALNIDPLEFMNKSEKIPLRLIHETNPRKYFPALFLLEKEGKIELQGEHRYSVVKEWFRAAIRDRRPFLKRTKNSFKDLILRFQIPFIKEENILFGFAPWDWRLIYLLPLLRKNKIIYHTSWPDWKNVPNRYAFLTPLVQKLWTYFLSHPNVNIVSLTKVVADSLKEETTNQSTIISHSVPSVFYKARDQAKKEQSNILKLLYVGEVSEKKGIPMLLDLAKSLQDHPIHFTIIGDGQLREECIEASKIAAVDFRGPIYNRSELAAVMADHDILLLLSQRTGTWREFFGIVIIEALAAGLGVIATTHIGPMRIFADKNCGNLFQEHDSRGIRDRLIELSHDSEKLEHFKSSQVDIAEQYHINSVAAKWFELLNNDRFFQA